MHQQGNGGWGVWDFRIQQQRTGGNGSTTDHHQHANIRQESEMKRLMLENNMLRRQLMENKQAFHDCLNLLNTTLFHPSAILRLLTSECIRDAIQEQIKVINNKCSSSESSSRPRIGGVGTSELFSALFTVLQSMDTTAAPSGGRDNRRPDEIEDRRGILTDLQELLNAVAQWYGGGAVLFNADTPESEALLQLVSNPQLVPQVVAHLYKVLDDSALSTFQNLIHNFDPTQQLTGDHETLIAPELLVPPGTRATRRRTRRRGRRGGRKHGGKKSSAAAAAPDGYYEEEEEEGGEEDVSRLLPSTSSDSTTTTTAPNNNNNGCAEAAASKLPSYARWPTVAPSGVWRNSNETTRFAIMQSSQRRNEGPGVL